MKLVKFYKVPCTSCTIVSNYLEIIGVKPDAEYDFDIDKSEVTEYDIMSVPTLLLIDDDNNVVMRANTDKERINELLEKAGLL